VSKGLSRQELSKQMEQDSLVTIYATAFVFLTAGSIWVHLGLGINFFSLPILASWLLVHVASFLTLRYKNHHRVLLGLSLIAFEFYCISMRARGFVMLPLAPAFFVISVPALIASYRWRPSFYVGFWSILWTSAILWGAYDSELDPSKISASGFTIGLNALFVFGFCWISKAYAERQSRNLQGMGARETYDSQRIHASRLQTLGELSAGLAHEIASPLTNIHGYVYQLDEELKEQQNKNEIVTNAIDRVNANIERVMAIARALKNFSRKGFSHTEDSKVSIKQLFDDAILLTQENLKVSNVEFIAEVPSEDIMLAGDRTELSQILINFIMNARDAVVKAPVKRVVFSMRSLGDSVEIWVQDSGGGVPPQHYAEVFNPFYTSKGVGAGTGLGLYISKMISDRHKAEIGFQNVVEQPGMPSGARFYLKVKRFEERKSENVA